jgi:N-methylhydantoinase B
MSSKITKLEIIKNSLLTIAEEMGAVLIRASFSTNIKDRRDCSCAIYTSSGELASQAEHIPIHLGVMPSAIQAILGYCEKESIELQSGDTILCNDPFITGSHPWDIMAVTPVINKGELIAIVGNLAHHADIGEHKSHVGREALDEGLRIPPVKLVKKGKIDLELVNLIKNNVRSEEIDRDLRAQIGSNLKGVMRLNEMVAKIGTTELHENMNVLINYSEKRLRNAIFQLDERQSSFEDYIEGDGINEKLVKIKATVKIKNSEIKIDFTDTDDITEGPINSPFPVTLACAGYTVKALLDPDLPSNEGLFRPIKLFTPYGSMVNASYPAAVAYANSVTCMRIVDVLIGAFEKIIPDKICAASTGTMNALNIKGINPSTNKFYGYIETYAGGWGATKEKDGLDATHTHMTNTMNAPVEAIEIAYPLLVHKYGIIKDSEGAGKNRGGVGITREIEALGHTATLGGRGDRVKIKPWGLQGGEEAQGSAYFKKLMNGKIIKLPSKFQGIQLKPGERIVIETAGGGGYGNPKERNSQLVLKDIINGFVSEKKAKETYGLRL